MGELFEERFADRREAGRVVAARLTAYRGAPGLLVLGLPRGGVPVAAEVARELGAHLDVLVVRKVGMPKSPEVAMGAIAATAGTIETVRNRDVLARMSQDGAEPVEAAFSRVAAREAAELERRQRSYRGDRPPVEVAGRTVLVVDDGIATGATIRAAVMALRVADPGRIVVAVPVGSRAACDRLEPLVDEVVCARMPEPFWAVGQAYVRFDQTADEEVQRILASFPPDGIAGTDRTASGSGTDAAGA